jgi:hypothetical protein
MCGLILFEFLMGTYLLEMNRWCFGWHIFLDCEELVFGLIHNSWLWTCFVHRFVHLFHPFYPFIHYYFSFLDTWQNIPPCHEFFLPCVNKIFLQKFDPTHLLMFTYSHSNSHAHQIVIPLSKWLFMRQHCLMNEW